MHVFLTYIVLTVYAVEMEKIVESGYFFLFRKKIIILNIGFVNIFSKVC